MTEINPKVINWFEGRGIGAETVSRMGIYSATRADTGDEAGAVMPHPAGNIIVFPFVEGDRVVAEKYRAAGKRFWQKKGGRKTFYNSDVLDDPALFDDPAKSRTATASLLITEGEMDCLTAIECGYPYAVSVPDGAPPARDKDGNLIVVPETASDIDPANDDKFRCIPNNLDRLNRVKRIIIAADADEPGRRLAAELVRRLGRVRCLFVSYPDGCKDLNEVLMRLGHAEVIRVIQSAQPYPVSGLYRLSELPREPDLETVSTGFGRLDDHIRLYFPSLTVITGLAGGGKSTFANQMAAQIAWRNAWHFGIASFEMRIRPFVTDTLIAAYLGRPKRDWTDFDREEAEAWIERRFSFIAPEPDDEAPHDVDWLLQRAQAAVIRHGMRALIIDPWNEIEHARRRDESISEYTGRAIRSLKSFGRNFDCAVIVVAHPTKSGAEKAPDKIGLYDVSDSAHFANKADLGVVIARRGEHEGDVVTAVMVRKVRYQPETGRPGKVELSFDRSTGLFSQ